NLVFSTPVYKQRVCPTLYWTIYVPVSVYHESTVGADKYDLLFYVTHTDEMQQNWVTTELTKYKNIAEIRKERGY
ncbi:MAG: hypothetical protein PHU08_06640, partial [Dehalococcoidales bacterium]|nr:hypothetical protein [Dehalococcoidales bacterium]